MMHFEQFEFVGLSVFMQRLTEYGPELSYVTVCAHPSRVQLYRMELESGPLGDWLTSQVAEPPHIEDWSSLLAGLDIWFRSVMSSGISSSQRREFHVQAVLPKGGGRPVGGKVVVQGLSFDDEQDPVDPPSQASPKLSIMKPDLSEADSTEISKNFRNVGEQYTHVTHLALSTASELKEMLQDQIKDQREANQQLRQENSELRQENRNMLRRLEEQVQSQREHTNTSNEQVYGLAKLQVANNAVAQVAGTLQSFLAMKAGAGLPPALQGLLHAIVQNPALLAAVQEPDVQGLLQDQQVLTALAAQLRDFASMKKLAAPQPVPS